MLPIISIIGGAVARIFAVDALKFIAQKAMLYTLFTLILPVILYNVFTRILKEVMEYTAAHMGGQGMAAITVQLTGMAGWIAQQIKLPTALSIILSAVALKFTLSFIRR